MFQYAQSFKILSKLGRYPNRKDLKYSVHFGLFDLGRFGSDIFDTLGISITYNYIMRLILPTIHACNIESTKEKGG